MAKPIKIKADIMWASLYVPNELSNKYQVDLCNLSPAASQALADMGIEVKDHADKGAFITCKSKNPIRAFDNDGVPIEEEVGVGNGSKALAVIDTYTWKFKNKEGLSPSLLKLVITDLVPYGDGAAITVDDDDEVL